MFTLIQIILFTYLIVLLIKSMSKVIGIILLRSAPDIMIILKSTEENFKNVKRLDNTEFFLKYLILYILLPRACYIPQVPRACINLAYFCVHPGSSREMHLTDSDWISCLLDYLVVVTAVYCAKQQIEKEISLSLKG